METKKRNKILKQSQNRFILAMFKSKINKIIKMI